MDILIVLAFFILLALAAPRWGVDSREPPRSKEWHQAQCGLAWPERAG
jgi:hypothetical protein